MSQPADMFDSYDVVGARESLEDEIYMISPTKTPFLTSLRKAPKPKQKHHEWQIDTLATAVATNAVIEGDDATTDAITATTRVGNYCQISDKVVLLAGTVEAEDMAGRGSELDYQMAKRMKELKRDLESQLTQNKASVVGTNAVARVSASFESWITTNDSRGAGGSQGGYNAGTSVVDAPTDGTQRAFTETLLKDCLQQCFTSGGDPRTVMLGPFNKRTASTFTGNATREVKAEGAKLFAAIDMYDSDWGTISFVPNRFSRDRSALVIDPDYWSIAYLRGFQSEMLAKTGDSVRKQLLVEYCLISRNEASSGIVADLTTS